MTTMIHFKEREFSEFQLHDHFVNFRKNKNIKKRIFLYGTWKYALIAIAEKLPENNVQVLITIKKHLCRRSDKYEIY